MISWIVKSAGALTAPLGTTTVSWPSGDVKEPPAGPMEALDGAPIGTPTGVGCGFPEEELVELEALMQPTAATRTLAAKARLLFRARTGIYAKEGSMRSRGWEPQAGDRPADFSL